MVRLKYKKAVNSDGRIWVEAVIVDDCDETDVEIKQMLAVFRAVTT